MGWTDVSINSQAMICEKLGGKSTIGFFHASYALGALFGVLYGGSLLQIDVSILNIFMYFAAIAIIPTISLRIWLFTKGEEKIINDNNKEKLSEIETFPQTYLESHSSSMLRFFWGSVTPTGSQDRSPNWD